MLPAVEMILKESNIPVVLRTSEDLRDENLFYVIGREPNSSNMVLIIKKRPVLLVSELEIDNYHIGSVEIKKLEKATLKREISLLKGRVGINFESLTLGQMKRMRRMSRAKFVDISKIFEKLREIKNQEEISKIKSACKLTEEILSKVPQMIKCCKTERELALKMEFEARQNGASGLSFPTIVASGKSSAIPHYETSTKKICRGFLLVDFGIIYNGYCSDITRTFFVGKPAHERNIYSSVFEAKQKATKECFAGNTFRKVHQAAESVLKSDLNSKLIHSVSHGIGLKVHDFPMGINLETKGRLQENMCLTVEPGYYKNNMGGVRIEDVIVIKKRKCRELSRAPKELVEIH